MEICKDNPLQESYNYLKIHEVMIEENEEFREKKIRNEFPINRSKKRVELKHPLLRNQTLIEQPFKLHSIYILL